MWMMLLAKAVTESSRAAVAERLGVSRPAISLVMAGKYPASTDRIEARVIEVYGRVHCPALDAEIGRSECRGHSSAAIPTSSPRALRHWRTCRTCEHREDAKCK